MSHWWKYPLSDVLPFSLEAFYRFLESYGQAIWPLQLLVIIAGLVLVYQVGVGRTVTARPVLLMLGCGWLLVAGLYFHSHYVQLFWAGTFFAIAFAVQGLLLLSSTTMRVSLAPIRTLRRNMAAVVLAIAIVGYPLIGSFHIGFGQLIETFGAFPDATSLATLAVLASMRGWARLVLMLVPMLWCIVSSAILITLGGVAGVPLAVLTCLAIATALVPDRAGR